MLKTSQEFAKFQNLGFYATGMSKLPTGKKKKKKNVRLALAPTLINKDIFEPI